MTFKVDPAAYDRFMGRFSALLSPQMAELSRVTKGQRVIDVGCGPGSLTTELVSRLGADSVTAVDPSGPFVEAARERHPGVAVEQASAEDLPFPDDNFDAALAQLVVHFMTDPVGGIREMGRVTKPGGIVTACVWDHAGGHAPLGIFWQAARDVDPDVEDESELAGGREGHLVEIFEEAGLRDVEQSVLSLEAEIPTFEDWWDPFELGVGPSGAYTTSLDPERRAALRERCRELQPAAPFMLEARAWAARGIV